MAKSKSGSDQSQSTKRVTLAHARADRASSAELAVIAEMNLSILQVWQRPDHASGGIIFPERNAFGKGSPIHFPWSQILIVCACEEMRKLGMPPGLLRTLSAHLHQWSLEELEESDIDVNPKTAEPTRRSAKVPDDDGTTRVTIRMPAVVARSLKHFVTVLQQREAYAAERAAKLAAPPSMHTQRGLGGPLGRSDLTRR